MEKVAGFMGKMKRPVVLLMIAVLLIVSGCTGSTRPANEQVALKKLYTAAMGTLMHWQIGRAVADRARQMGATSAGIDLGIPGTKLQADIYARWRINSRLTEREVYELKPISWNYGGRYDEAVRQLDTYVNPLQEHDDTSRLESIRGYRMMVPLAPPGWAVPLSYTPELRNNCMQAVVMSGGADSEGVLYYFYKWDPAGRKNGKPCKDRTRDQKKADISNMLWTAQDIIKNNYGVYAGRYRMAQEDEEDNIDEIYQDARQIRMGQGYSETIDPASPTDQQVFDSLMDKYVPSWFTQPWPWMVPGAPESGETWDCPSETRACA